MTPAAAKRLRLARGIAFDIGIFVLATAAAYLAQANDRRVSTALIYLVGVMVIGARAGLVRGLVAAIAASAIYNFFISEPAYRFGAGSADEFVPLAAFNLSAILTGALAGRLKDSARIARAAEGQNAFLLRLSDSLQGAITVADVERIAREILPYRQVLDLEIRIAREWQVPAGTGSTRAYPLNGSEGEIGGVSFVLGPENPSEQEPDLQGIASILGLAVDRCLLLERLGESQALQKSEELKTAILSSVSHDLRTPLTAIEAAATSLRSYEERMSQAQKAAMLATISEQCGKLNRYTANLLNMGRIQSGIPAERFVQIDVVEILGVVLGALRQAHPEQRINKQILLDAAVVNADPAMLEQVIFNLVDNAAVHGGGGQPIEIRLRGDGASCVLEVIDSGPGIAADEQALVFERFYRSRSSVHRQGSGLGLHIAQGFAQAFGGAISIRSPARGGLGTRMALRLPMVADRHARIGPWE